MWAKEQVHAQTRSQRVEMVHLNVITKLVLTPLQSQLVPAVHELGPQKGLGYLLFTS